MKLCVIAETKEPDIYAYTQIIQKLLVVCCNVNSSDISFVDFSPSFRSKGQLIKQLAFSIRIILDQNPDLDLIFVIVDNDKSEGNEQRKVIEKEVAKVSEFPEDRIIIGIAERNIEAWMLCDEKNLRELSSLTDILSYKKVESISDPKSILKDIWKRSKDSTKYYPKFLSRVSELINVERILAKSKRFKSFVEETQAAVNLIKQRRKSKVVLK